MGVTIGRQLLLITALVGVAALTGCRRSDNKPQPSEPAAAAEPEPWASKPPREWPQLVLSNQADFTGHTPLRGASAFLIKTQDGRTLVATARHLLGVNGGVEPEIRLPRLNAAIRSWRLYPRTLPDQFVSVDGVGAEGLEDENLDWLVLTIKGPAGQLPATPLRLRPGPVQVGEKVLLVGCPYSEATCKQNVYVGKVTARDGDRFRYDIEPPVDIRGFSGAPVLDSDGHVAGVMTVWFEPRMRGQDHLEAGGEDSASIYQLVERRR
jgi:hypothetical protein